MNGWREGLGNGRSAPMPVELPPRREFGGPPRPAEREPRLVASPTAPKIPLARLVVRVAAGSVGLSLAVGVVVGRWTAVEAASPASANSAAELRVRGAGHLDAVAGAEIAGEGRLLTDAALIRERLLGTGVPKRVSVERVLPGGVRVEVEEKRAVALLDWEPPAALAADGTVLGRATVADFAWAGAADLVLIRGAERIAADFAERTALAGRLAAALAHRPELDRLVSEVDVSGGPYRVRAVLRSPSLSVLLTETDFLGGLERVAVLLPDLVERWPGLTRVDARVADRLLVRTGGAAAPPTPPLDSPGGQSS